MEDEDKLCGYSLSRYSPGARKTSSAAEAIARTVKLASSLETPLYSLPVMVHNAIQCSVTPNSSSRALVSGVRAGE